MDWNYIVQNGCFENVVDCTQVNFLPVDHCQDLPVASPVTTHATEIGSSVNIIVWLKIVSNSLWNLGTTFQNNLIHSNDVLVDFIFSLQEVKKFSPYYFLFIRKIFFICRIQPRRNIHLAHDADRHLHLLHLLVQLLLQQFLVLINSFLL